MILETLISTLASGGLGGIVGGVGGILQKVWSQKLEAELKVQEWSHIERMHYLQEAADRRRDSHALDISNAQGSWTALDSSIQAEAKITGTSTWVNNFRALVRPMLTTSVLALAVFFPVFMNLATMTVAWWFGSRGSAEGNR